VEILTIRVSRAAKSMTASVHIALQSHSPMPAEQVLSFPVKCGNAALNRTDVARIKAALTQILLVRYEELPLF
jgi:hypothetical protein